MDPSAWVGRSVGGRYRLIAPLGKGGVGQVFRGVQDPLGREVAVKLLRPDVMASAAEEYQARFLREAALAGRISHPNVVTVHDYGVTPEGVSYVVMELLEGTLLADLVADDVALEPSRAVRIVIDIAKGLGAAHALGLIHRDVKPHNIMVVQQDGKERAVLLDFGLVKVQAADDPLTPSADGYRTRQGSYMGTPAYMPPEQANSTAMDHRADLYALGVVLYKLLTGVVPFWGDTPLSLAVQHLYEPVPAMAERVPGSRVPAELEGVTRRLMEKEPADRYPSTIELIDTLEHWLHGPVFAPAPPAPPSDWSSAILGAGLGALGLAAAFLAAVGTLFVVVFSLPVREPVLALPDVEGRPIEPTEDLPEFLPVPEPPPEPEVAPEPRAPARPVERPTLPVPIPRPTAPSEGVPMPMPGDVVAANAVVVDGVILSQEGAARALRFVNEASAEELRRAGVYDNGVRIILDKRPFSSLEAFGATYGVGKKTVEVVSRAGR